VVPFTEYGRLLLTKVFDRLESDVDGVQLPAQFPAFFAGLGTRFFRAKSRLLQTLVVLVQQPTDRYGQYEAFSDEFRPLTEGLFFF